MPDPSTKAARNATYYETVTKPRRTAEMAARRKEAAERRDSRIAAGLPPEVIADPKSKQFSMRINIDDEYGAIEAMGGSTRAVRRLLRDVVTSLAEGRFEKTKDGDLVLTVTPTPYR